MTLLTFERWDYQVDGKPGLIHVNPEHIVMVSEIYRFEGHFNHSPRVNVAVLEITSRGRTFSVEVLDRDRTVGQRIREALEREAGH